MRKLASLSDSAQLGIRYFSGVASYTATIASPAGLQSGKPLWLDLGAVGDIAQVSVNGMFLETVWHAPFRVDISRALGRGRNRLEIKVANLWVNRLIGDAQPGASKVAWTSIPTYLPSAQLRPSGLIGPVRLWRDGD
jgi:hypothetical protein